MTTPFISLTVSILYFACLWHNRRAKDRSQRQSSNQPAKKSSRANESRALDLAPVSRVTPKPFNLEDVSTPVAQGATQ
jgi:hypothetical protein